MTIMSSFTRLYVIQNLYDWLSSVQHERRYFLKNVLVFFVHAVNVVLHWFHLIGKNSWNVLQNIFFYVPQ